MDEKNTDEFIEGACAYYEGESFTKNPYQQGSKEYSLWYTGWVEAEWYENNGMKL